MRATVCQGCGTELPPPVSTQGHRRKWCSERCRKRQYAGACVDCGAPTNGYDGPGKASLHCAVCGQRQSARTKLAQAEPREAAVAALYREGLTAWQAAERLGLSSTVVAEVAKNARKHGLDCPYAPRGRRAHRGRVAA